MAKLRITSHRLQLEVADKESPDGMSLHFYNLPENCTTITDKLYRGRTDVFELTVVSHRVKQIGLNAFEGCSELTKVQLSPSVKYIEANAFAGCDKLEKVILDEIVDRVDYLFSAAVKCTEHKPFPSLIANLKKINKQNEKVIPLMYDMATPFSEYGLAVVKINGETHYIDKGGELYIYDPELLK